MPDSQARNQRGTTGNLGRQQLGGKVSPSQLKGWVFDPQPLSELP